MEVIDKIKQAITPGKKEEKLKAAQTDAAKALFSKEKLDKRIEFAEKSIDLANDTLELLKSFDYMNEDESCIIDLGDIVHNLAVMTPERMKALFPVLIAQYEGAVHDLENIKAGTEKFRQARFGN